MENFFHFYKIFQKYILFLSNKKLDGKTEMEKQECIEPDIEVSPNLPNFYFQPILYHQDRVQQPNIKTIPKNDEEISVNREKLKFEKIQKQKKTKENTEIVNQKVKFIHYLPQDDILLKNCKYKCNF